MGESKQTGTLYLVGTPIGNLKDLTIRALETLQSVDLIAAEDTRHTQKLLNHYAIQNRSLAIMNIIKILKDLGYWKN